MTIREIENLFNLEDKAFESIRAKAQRLTEHTFKNQVYVRGLIEFSNYCRCSCLYCGLRVENDQIKRFRLSPKEILEITYRGYQLGYRSFVWQSGEDDYYSESILTKLVKQAKNIGDIAITLSIGERDKKVYSRLKEAGVDRFLIKHECADAKIYNSLHPHSDFKTRISCLKNLKVLGYQVGSGFMIGLPGQTIQTLAKDLLLLKGLKVHMAGIGPFIPHKETPLGDCESGQIKLSLRAVALTRLLVPTAMLPVTTSLGVLDSKMKDQCLKYGANVVMQKLEPTFYRKLYMLYPKEVIEGSTLEEEKRALEEWLMRQGKVPVFERGDHIDFSK